MSNRKTALETIQEYNTAMKRIDVLMKKGEDNITEAEAHELKSLALAVNAYEKHVYEIPLLNRSGRGGRR